MASKQCEIAADGIVLSGSVVFGTVASLYAEGCALLADFQGKECAISFNRIDQVDSAALTLMLSWLRFSASRGMQVRFLAVPSGLYRIAELSGVVDLLQLES